MHLHDVGAVNPKKLTCRDIVEGSQQFSSVAQIKNSPPEAESSITISIILFCYLSVVITAGKAILAGQASLLIPSSHSG